MSFEKSFLQDFQQLSQIGSTSKGGVDRQAGTDTDAKTKEWFTTFAKEIGLIVMVDAIGNQFAKSKWLEDKPSILIGSHLDSQPLGGKFDGAYGVIAALYVAKILQEEISKKQWSPNYNLIVVNWFNEEGARFSPSLMGSSAFAGIYPLQELLETKDAKGIRVKEALEHIGYLGNADPGPIINYAEIHIEQGRILDREKIDIGLVTESWHTQKLDIKVLGEQSHTGATAMADRRDALITAAKIILLVQRIIDQFPPESIVSSVGQFDVYPNSPIVVAREVRLVADLRSNDHTIVQEARDKLFKEIQALASQDQVEIIIQDFDIRPKRFLVSEGVTLNKKLAKDLHLTSIEVATMAGHDAIAMSTVIPTMMLFIPSKNGVSHCERELTTDQDMLNGINLFKESIKHLLLTPMAFKKAFYSQSIES